MNPAFILVVDDEPDIRDLVREILEDEGYRVATAADAASARAACLEEEPDLVLLDIWMPGDDGITLLKEWKVADKRGFPVIMMSGHGTVETAVEATRQGALDFVEKPLSLARLLLVVGQALAHVDETRGGIGESPAAELIGSGAAMKTLRDHAQKLAQSTTPLVIRGAPGSGKRSLARYIHAHSQSQGRSGPFVEVDAGRLEEPGPGQAGASLQSVLRQAGAGTLFLHGLEGLTPTNQSLLLEVVSSPERGGARLIGASSADLPRLVERGAFREDLLYRLGAVQLSLPLLTEHREDIPELLEYFVNWFVKNEGLAYRHFNVAAQNRLRHYDWPGNVTELRNLVQRLMILGNGAEIDAEEVEAALEASREHGEAGTSVMQVPLGMPLRQAREEFERAYLEQQLRAVGGSVSELAKIAGMERTHLYRKLRNLGIEHQKQRN